MSSKPNGWRWVGRYASMLVVLAILVSVVVARMRDSSSGFSMQLTIGAIVVPITLLVGGVVIWQFVRPNTLRLRFLRKEFPDALALTVRRTSDLVAAIVAVDSESPLADTRTRLGLWFTVVADGDGLGIWIGKDEPTRVLWIPRSSIVSIEQGTLADGELPFAGIAIQVHAPGGEVALPLIPSSSLPGGAYPALPRTVNNLRTELARVALRSR